MFSNCWNLNWLSDWTLDSLFDNLSNLKFTSSNLFVNSWNWFSISDNFKRCLVSTSSELWSKELFENYEISYKCFSIKYILTVQLQTGLGQSWHPS